ncbi:primosomal protein N' [Lagierella sp.]|uniref:primosomal protein N' n=1 Tax=Lagierella sp. TaxID=2849657 RepID=UPI00260C8584|nr:primosomal protein N' [Lagierella sp.]
MIANIVLESKTRVLDRLFSYLVPDNIKNSIERGTRVIVPFGLGNTKRLGIVVELTEKPLIDIKLKEIYKLVDDEPLVSQDLIETALFMRRRYLSDLSSAFQQILPPGNWKDLEKLLYLKEDPSSMEIEIFFRTPKSVESAIDKFGKERIEDLVKNHILVEKYDIKGRVKPRTIEYYSINKELRDGVSLSGAPVQEKIYKFILENGPMDRKSILMNTGGNSSSLKSLVKKGILEVETKHYFIDFSKEFSKYEKIMLNSQQQSVLNEILNNDKNRFLIHGITGSGKTEIYLQIVESMLKEGKSSIILVPEISLTPQTIERFSGRFPNKVAVLHSKLTQREKLEQWQQIKNGTFPIVIGARSAIFAPVKNLGAIIIDEAHDSSYISDRNPKYITREVAEMRSDILNSKLILGSATPDIESYYLGERGVYEILTLNKRATSGTLPDVKVIDMREELKKGNMSVIGEDLYEAIGDNLKAKKQTILFLNKRGHTSYVFCRRCGFVMKCDSCDVSMTYHKSKNILICHQCGRTGHKPLTCPNCSSKYIREFGAGTEKVEEFCRKEFPDARIFRMDADTVKTRDQYLRVFQDMKSNNIDILIGTQMITKGFDFPNVTLVGVIAADLSLNIGSYKASENTFQLITQVSGRAGRGDYRGQVYIQTYRPDDYSIVTSSEQNFDDFYKMEIDFRRRFKYPPFYKIFSINISGLNRIATRQKLFTLQSYIQSEFRAEKIREVETIGPNPCPISRINNRYRFYSYFKYNKNEERIKDIFKKVLIDNKYKVDLEGYKLSLTFDPTNFI